MIRRNRSVLKRRSRVASTAGVFLAGLFVLAGCSDDPSRPNVEPEPTFSATFADGEFKAAFQESEDGCYVAAGTGADDQGFIYRIDRDGNEVSHYSFVHNASTEFVRGALPAGDGGFMLCGYSGDQGWVAVIDSSLQTVEDQFYTGSAREDYFNAMTERPDGGFILGGHYDWDRSWDTGDGWLVRVSSHGVYEDQTTFGGDRRDFISAIIQDGDGGFFFAGASLPPATIDSWAWICRTNAAADALLWNKTYLYNTSSWIGGLAATQDGGCVCVGSSLRMETPNYGSSDGYVIRIDSDGDMVWTWGSLIDGPDGFYAVTPAHNGGYLCAGRRSNPDLGWLMKIDEDGDKAWEKTFEGGTIYSIRQASGAGYVCSGEKDGKAWLLRLDVSGGYEQ